MKNKFGICELCERDGLELTEHHLTPKEEGGAFLPTSNLCIPCHKQIHALYTNQELASRLYTIELLHKDERISKYLKWIRKQDAGLKIKIKKSNDKKLKQFRK